MKSVLLQNLLDKADDFCLDTSAFMLLQTLDERPKKSWVKLMTISVVVSSHVGFNEGYEVSLALLGSPKNSF